MITDFLRATIDFEVKLRDDAGADLEVTIGVASDGPFQQKTSVWCISEKDIDEMIAELQYCKVQVRKWCPNRL